jgi:c-di-GMP-binding flagellar brake protein YcgR
MSLTVAIDNGGTIVLDREKDGTVTLTVNGSTVTLPAEHHNAVVEFLSEPSKKPAKAEA